MEVLAFLGVAAVVICSPGPDTALTIRNTLSGGRSAGVGTAAGVAAGQLVWTVAAGLGIVTVLLASQTAFQVLRLAGAAYLVVLGVQALWSAARRHPPRDHDRGRAANLVPARALRQGLISNLANPKMVAFFLSVLPQFLPAGEPALAGFLAFGALFCLLTFGWLSLYAVVLHQARTWFDRAAIRRTLDALTGTVLMGFGVRLAVPRT